jgi:hypothetical protein
VLLHLSNAVARCVSGAAGGDIFFHLMVHMGACYKAEGKMARHHDVSSHSVFTLSYSSPT